MKIRHLILPFAPLLAALLTSPALAQEEADTCLKQLIWDAQDSSEEEWKVRSATTAKVKLAEPKVFLLNLMEGDYRFIICAEAQLPQVELRLYDADGKVLTETAATDARELRLEHTTLTAGAHYLTVTFTSTTNKPKDSWVGTAVTYKKQPGR